MASVLETVIHNTFVIERSYPVAPERDFSAFSDPRKKRRWFAEGDHHDVEEFLMEFREGGMERASYRLREGTPFPGVVIAGEGIFLDIVEGRRIVSASTMSFGGKKI